MHLSSCAQIETNSSLRSPPHLYHASHAYCNFRALPFSSLSCVTCPLHPSLPVLRPHPLLLLHLPFHPPFPHLQIYYILRVSTRVIFFNKRYPLSAMEGTNRRILTNFGETTQTRNFQRDVRAFNVSLMLWESTRDIHKQHT